MAFSWTLKIETSDEDFAAIEVSRKQSRIARAEGPTHHSANKFIRATA